MEKLVKESASAVPVGEELCVGLRVNWKVWVGAASCLSRNINIIYVSIETLKKIKKPG